MPTPRLPRLRNIYCLGRTYRAHAVELGNRPEPRPLVFMKPASCVVPDGGTVAIPAGAGACHHEVEMALLVGGAGHRLDVGAARRLLAGAAVAIDLTLRERQSALKQRGHPWETAKCFAGSCPMSGFLPLSALGDPDQTRLELWVDDELRQDGTTADRELSAAACIAYVSEFFPLERGDVILTGTPPGVGPVLPGQRLRARLGGQLELRVDVVAGP